MTTTTAPTKAVYGVNNDAPQPTVDQRLADAERRLTAVQEYALSLPDVDPQASPEAVAADLLTIVGEGISE